MHLRDLERVFTKHFLPAVSGMLVIAWTIYVAIVAQGVSLEDLAKVIDALFKIAAVIVGTGWALNRYFTARTDSLQLRIDPVVDVVRPTVGASALFLCRLDIVNTGNALTSTFRGAIEIDAVGLADGNVIYESVARWPKEGLHVAAPIEPGSWSALSLALPLPSTTAAVRVDVQLHFAVGGTWTWQRHFKIAEDGVA